MTNEKSLKSCIHIVNIALDNNLPADETARNGKTILYGDAPIWKYCKVCSEYIEKGSAVIAVSTDKWPEKIVSQKDVSNLPIESSIVVYSCISEYQIGKTVGEGDIEYNAARENIAETINREMAILKNEHKELRHKYAEIDTTKPLTEEDQTKLVECSRTGIGLCFDMLQTLGMDVKKRPPGYERPYAVAKVEEQTKKDQELPKLETEILTSEAERLFLLYVTACAEEKYACNFITWYVTAFLWLRANEPELFAKKNEIIAELRAKRYIPERQDMPPIKVTPEELQEIREIMSESCTK